MSAATAKPWVSRNRVAPALRNEHVVIGQGRAGRGLFAARAFVPGEAVASFHGRVIARADLLALGASDRALYERINEYAITTPSGGHLFTDDMDAPGAHLINHSCAPNAAWAEWDRGALLVRAVRPIAEGEELTAFYGWLGVKAAIEKSWHPCACGAPFCAGTIELRVEWEVYSATEAGPWLPEEEGARRFLADIVNDTDEHEGLMFRYAKGSLEMALGAKVVSALDPSAFMEKLRSCADVAVRTARRLPASRVSERRLRRIVAAYDLSIGGS